MADRVGGTAVGGGHAWVMGSPPSLLRPSFCPPYKLNKQLLGIFPNHWLTTTWARRNPIGTEEGRRERESFSGHHCGNVVNCAFLRPWESHTRAGTCGHGKGVGGMGGASPKRGEVRKQHQQHYYIYSYIAVMHILSCGTKRQTDNFEQILQDWRKIVCLTR